MLRKTHCCGGGGVSTYDRCHEVGTSYLHCPALFTYGFSSPCVAWVLGVGAELSKDL